MDYCDAKGAVSTPEHHISNTGQPTVHSWTAFPAREKMHQLDTGFAFGGATAGFLGLREC
jgi:hypothetical protein